MSYKYRIAFGAWINDMRNENLPLQNWPAPELDEETVNSLIKTMDIQSQAGFNMLDAWGLFATYGYPPDIESVFLDKDRRVLIDRVFKAADERNIKILFGMGLFTWGYDKIIEYDPEVRGVDPSGNPHPHALCGSKEKAWGYVEKIIDSALSNYNFGGVHLESADLGWCSCPECAGKYGVVGYNVRLNIHAGNYIRSKYPDKVITAIPINWLPTTDGRWHFTDGEKDHLVELSRHIDCLMDQGWNQPFIQDGERKDFIRRLYSDYGTSGGLWLYPDTRWDRSSYFLPYVKRTGDAIKRHYDDGARGCMFYQGPVNNPGTEANIAAGGRILSNITRSINDVLEEVLELYYKPKNENALLKLVDIFLRAEDGYFSHWSNERLAHPPGEFKLSTLWGTSPGAGLYLMEPYLDADGRQSYKQILLEILKDLAEIKGEFQDNGRLLKIKRGITITLNLINTIKACKGEPWQD